MPKERQVLFVDTPIGILSLVAVGGRLVEIRLPQEDGTAAVDALAARAGDKNPVLRATAELLRRYFSGESVRWDGGGLDNGTPFQQAVWRATAGIPFGETISYGQLANRIGKPGAARAVGGALGRNPLPILIPCHRVIGADGGLCGFGGGLEMKRRLLAHEGVVTN